MLNQNLAKMSHSMSQNEQTRISKRVNFTAQEFLKEVQSLWSVIDVKENNNISKHRFYRFLSEFKIAQNADQAKSEEFFKSVMIDWGSQPDALNENRQKDFMIHVNPQFETKYKNSSKKYEQPKPLVTFDKIECIQKSLFERMFSKTVILFSLNNAVNLMDLMTAGMSKDQSENDRVWATLKAIHYKRSFLYSIFSHSTDYDDLKRKDTDKKVQEGTAPKLKEKSVESSNVETSSKSQLRQSCHGKSGLKPV